MKAFPNLFASVLLLPLMTLGGILAQPPAIAAESPVAAPEIGLEFAGSRELNRTTIVDTEYTGDCPGVEVGTREARFSSTKTTPNEHRRVTVKNMTRGLGETPYTDREYDKGRVSEGTVMQFGTEHDSKYFIVMPGENTFQYEIRERDRVMDTGTFLTTIERSLNRVERNATWMSDEVCANTSVSNSVCADMRQRRQYKCPSGKVLRTEWRNDDDRAVRTRFYNATSKSIRFTFDGDSYQIRPGDHVNLRRNQNLSIGFDPKCADCSPSRYESVTYGKRMKFQMRGDRIDLVDDYK
jgi:hypothetical protein